MNIFPFRWQLPCQYIPSVLCMIDVALKAAITKYSDDLPSPELFQMELQGSKLQLTGHQCNQKLSTGDYFQKWSPADNSCFIR